MRLLQVTSTHVFPQLWIRDECKQGSTIYGYPAAPAESSPSLGVASQLCHFTWAGQIKTVLRYTATCHYRDWSSSDQMDRGVTSRFVFSPFLAPTVPCSVWSSISASRGDRPAQHWLGKYLPAALQAPARLPAPSALPLLHLQRVREPVRYHWPHSGQHSAITCPLSLALSLKYSNEIVYNKVMNIKINV